MEIPIQFNKPGRPNKYEHMHMFHCYDLEKQKEIMNQNLFSIPYACVSIIIGFIINLFFILILLL